MLSGALKAYSSYNKCIKLSLKITITNFKRKLKKVYPLYIITTLYMVNASTLYTNIASRDFSSAIDDLFQLAKNLLLIQSWFSANYFSYCGVGWFLSTIMFLYILETPLIYLASKIKQSKYNLIYLSSILLSSAGLIILYCYLTQNTNIEFWTYVFPPSRLGEFVMGICIGYIIRIIDEKYTFSKMSTYLFTLFEFVVLAFWVYQMCVPFAAWQYRIVHWLLPNTLLIIIFLVGKGYLSKLLSLRFFVWLGDISFECYLVHAPLIVVYGPLMANYSNLNKLGNTLAIFSSLFIVILISNCIYQLTNDKS